MDEKYFYVYMFIQAVELYKNRFIRLQKIIEY